MTMNDLQDPFMQRNLENLKSHRLFAIQHLILHSKMTQEEATEFVTKVMKTAVDETNNWHRRMNNVNQIEPTELFV
jgi:polyhydroxyalkanoate synthesis regulator phasin